MTLYFLSRPFPAFHVHETEGEQDNPVSVLCGPANGDVRLKIEYDIDDVENVERKRAEFHK